MGSCCDGVAVRVYLRAADIRGDGEAACHSVLIARGSECVKCVMSHPTSSTMHLEMSLIALSHAHDMQYSCLTVQSMSAHVRWACSPSN
jgi:hypothetical protein